MSETLFTKIKREVTNQKELKVRGEAKVHSLNEEKDRIFKSASEEINEPIESVEKVEEVCESLKTSIQNDVEEMAAILREEGIEV